MDKNNIYELIERLKSGALDAADQKQLEDLIATGEIDIDQIEDFHLLSEQVQKMSFPAPSADLDDRFYHMLALEKKSKARFSWKEIFSWPELAPKLALASVTLMIGLGVGYFTKPAKTQDVQIETLTKEVTDLKEMMMLSLIEKESATDRLKAVNLTQDMAGPSSKVTSALIQTLNNDDNVNVRLAALEALTPYIRDSHVRTEIIKSIAKQQSPLVQVALAELMGAIQEKSSLKEFEKIIQSRKTPVEVKKRIKESMKILS
jgi:hypothetical protein